MPELVGWHLEGGNETYEPQACAPRASFLNRAGSLDVFGYARPLPSWPHSIVTKHVAAGLLFAVHHPT